MQCYRSDSMLKTFKILFIILSTNLFTMDIQQSQSMPPELQYNHIRPKGFYSTYKEWIVQPQQSSAYWPGQNVKILIQSMTQSSGVMDPYRSHLQFQVQVNQQLLPVGLLQIDSSAQSFIEQLIVNSNNQQIERIPEYSVLAAWLTDIGLAQMHAQGRQSQGLGYSNLQSLAMTSKQTNNFVQTNRTGFDGTTGITDPIVCTGNGTVFPTQNSSAFVTRQGSLTNNGDPMSSKTIVGKNVKGHITTSNLAWLRTDKQVPWQVTNFPDPAQTPATQTAVQTSVVAHGYIKNLRAEYVQSMQSLSYPDSTTSIPSYQIHLKDIYTTNPVNPNQQWTGAAYKTFLPQTLLYRMPIFSNGAATNYYSHLIPNNTSLQGFSTLYSPNFCKGVRQPFISATVPQCQMFNGKILPQKIPIRKRIFKIPLISAILGILIPQDQFALIPLQALNQILIEFVIDKYAMFTSGNCDVSEFDDTGFVTKQQRAFQINRIQYKMHTYTFEDQQVNDYLTRSLMNKILINSNMWTLGNQYQIPKGQNVQNSHLINCNAQALNQVLALFVSNDYQRHSYCRKHFRLSNNITKFQIRYGNTFIPPQPMIGNGGNPQPYQDMDNSVYLQQIYWSTNFMFNKGNPIARINAYNFAINDRCYNPNREGPFYDRNVFIQQANHIWNSNSINQDTAMGMPWIHQNRYVGKAGYVLGFQPYSHSANHLTGLNCRQIQNLFAIFNVHPSDAFQRQQTLYIFTRCSVIVEYTINGIRVYGR